MRLKYSIIQLLLILLLFACIKDPCLGVFCENGECINGICLCEDGYINNNCNNTLAALLAGDYTLTSDCDSSFFDFNTNVSIVSNSNFIMNRGISVEKIFEKYPEYLLKGRVESEDSIIFPFQTDSLILDSILVPIYLDYDTVYYLEYTYNIITADGKAYRDTIDASINLEIVYNINDSLVTCTQFFVKD